MGANARVQTPFSPDEEDLVEPLTIALVRHGVTDMTVSRQMSGGGVPGPSLNSAGRVQVARAADAAHAVGRRQWGQLPHLTRIIASPMVRTQETAAAVGRRLGVHVESEPRLREVEFGEWEGLTIPQILAHSGDAIHEWRHARTRAPGGESIAQVGERAFAVVEQCAREHAAACMDGSDIPRGLVLVSHAVVIKSILGLALGAAPERWGAIWPSPASMSLVQARVRNDGTLSELHLLAVGIPVD